MTSNSWVTLATNDSYSLGALVLAHSLRRVHTAHQLTILVTPGVSSPMRNQLSAVFDVVEEVNVLDSRDEKNLALLTRPELGITFTKLHCWRLTQFAKCVFVDADVLVLQNCDELFEREELSAAPDVGWPDCFNSGVYVYQPSIDTYNAIINFALSKGSFDGGDQGLLNQFFSDWATRDISRHLPFIYNMCSTATYSYLPAFKQFGKDVKVVHFIGPAKPWLQYLDSQTRQVTPSSGSEHLQELLQLWWDIFCHHVHSSLSSDMAGLAGAFAQLTLGEARSAEQVALEEHLRKQAWEHGSIDYMGRDSFDNIWRKICQTLAQTPQDQGASDSSETLTGPVATESEAESTPTPALAESLPTPASQMNETILSSNSVSQTPDELPNSSQEAQRDDQLSQAVSSAEQDVGTTQATSAVSAAVGSDENVQAAMPASIPSEELVAAAADTHAPVIESTDSSDVTADTPLPPLPAAQSDNAVSTVPASPTVSTLSADVTPTSQTPVTLSSQSVTTVTTIAATIEPTLTVTTTPVSPPSVVLTPRAKVLEAVLAEYTRDMPSQPSGVEFQEPQMEDPQAEEAEKPQTLESPEFAEQTKSSGGLPGTSATLQNPEVKSTGSVASSDNFEYESVESVESGSSKSLPANDILPTDSSRCVPIAVQASSVETKNENKVDTSISAQPNPKLVSGGPTPSPNPVVVTAYVKQIPGVTIPPQSQFVAPPKAHASQTTCSTDQVTAIASSTESSDLKGAVQITGSSQSLIVTEPTPPTSPESASTSPLPVAISPQALQVESNIPATPPVGVPSAPEAASTPAPVPISTSEALALTPVQSTETATATAITEEAAAAISEQEAQHEPSVSQELPSTGQYNTGAPVPPKRNKKPGGKSAKNVKPQPGKK